MLWVYYCDFYVLFDEGKCVGVFDFGDVCVVVYLMGGVMGFMYIWYDLLCIDVEVLVVELLGVMMKIILLVVLVFGVKCVF